MNSLHQDYFTPIIISATDFVILEISIFLCMCFFNTNFGLFKGNKYIFLITDIYYKYISRFIYLVSSLKNFGDVKCFESDYGKGTDNIINANYTVTRKKRTILLNFTGNRYGSTIY